MNTKILKRAAMALTPVVMLAFNGCSSTSNDLSMANQQPPPPPPASPEWIGSGVVVEAATGTATVESFDARQGKLVLKRADGSTNTYKGAPGAINFDQIKVGDEVLATVTEDYAIFLEKGGALPGAKGTVAVARASNGPQSSGVMISTVDYTARVLEVNYDTRKVLLQCGSNLVRSVKAGPNVNLGLVNANDDVLVRATEAMAIAVVKP